MARSVRNVGMLLLGIFLILEGLGMLVSLPIPGLGVIEGLLALLAGIFILLGR